MIKLPHNVSEVQAADKDGVARDLRHFHVRIREKSQKRAAAPVVISAIGDSVTQGLAGIDEFLHDSTYHHQLKRMLERRYPLCIFSVINGGIEGVGADHATGQVQRDAIDHNPDLVLMAFGLNDAAVYGMEGIDAFGEQLRDHIEAIQGNCDANVIIMTPNMMLTRMNDRVPARYAHCQAPFLALQRDGVLEKFAQRAIEVAHEKCVPVADVYGAWVQCAEQGVDTTNLLANGLNHPSAEGHTLAARCVMDVVIATENGVYTDGTLQ